MFNKEYIKKIESIIGTEANDYIMKYDYNNPEYYRNECNIKEKNIDNFFTVKYFLEEINLIKDNKNKVDNLFELIIQNKCYNLATFIIERIDMDVSKLFNWFNENEDIKQLIKSNFPKDLLGFEILMYNTDKDKNLDKLKYYLYDWEILEKSYTIFKSNHINKHTNVMNLILNRANFFFDENILLNPIINLITSKDNLVAFSKLYDYLLKDKILINKKYINYLVDKIFKAGSINIINFLFEKIGIKLSSLDIKCRLFLLEYFSKNNLPENLKIKVINELFIQNNSKYYECKNINNKDNNFFYYGDISEPNGFKQTITNEVFEYNEENNSINLKADFVFLIDELLYEIEYMKNKNKKITYYEKGSNGKIPLLITNIDNNQINFDFSKTNYDIKTFIQKVDEIIYDFDANSVEYFDENLSNLYYAVLQFQQQNINKFSFILNCNSIYDLVDIIYDGLKQENKNKTYICDFNYECHNVQIIINNGKLTIVNTLNFPYNLVNWNIIEKIKENCKYKNLEVKELSVLNQSKNSCVISSKIYAVNLIVDYFKNFGNQTEFFKKLNKFLSLFEILADKNQEEQIKYIKDNISNDEYNEYFKMSMVISKINYKLLEKLKYFTFVQDKFKNFRNSLISRYKMELSPQENQIVKRSMIYSKFLKPFMEENFFDFIHILGSTYEYCNNIPFDIVNKLIKEIESNKITYTQINPINNKTFALSYKMNCFLIAIKMGNYDSISYYLKELNQYTNGNENLIKENLKNVLNTHFNIKNNPYILAVRNIFEEKINQIEQNLQNKNYNFGNIYNPEKIEEISKNLQNNTIKLSINEESKRLYNDNKLLTKTKNISNELDENVVELQLDRPM